MTLLWRIAERAVNRPLLIHPHKAAIIADVLAGRIGLDASELTPEASRFEGERIERDVSGRPLRMLPYSVSQGVGIISVVGTMVNRGAWIGANSGLVSYEGVKFQVAQAAADPNVRSILLDLESPGGEAVGAFEAAAAVREAAAAKPVVAVINGMAASAAYAIASAATRIVTTETGVSGSIGVVLLHADYSQRLEAEGVKPTLIFAGAHKVDGNPYEPLTDEVRSDLQAEVDSFYARFLDTVAAGRGRRLSARAARDTQARTFIGQEAVNAGLADEVGSFESALAALKRKYRGSVRSTARGTKMENETNTPAAAGFTQADLDRARADGEAAAYSRMSNVMALAASKGRERAALELAISAPGMSADQIGSFIEANVAVASSFDARADANPVNGIGAHSGNVEPEASKSHAWGQVHQMVATKKAR